MNYYYYYLINIKLTDIIETITITYSLFETYNFSFHRHFKGHGASEVKIQARKKRWALTNFI